MPEQLHRLPEQGQIAGVAAGLADYFRIDPTIVRVLFVVAAFMTGGMVLLLYLILAIILPVNGGASSRSQTILEGRSASRARNWLGGGLILFGAWRLINSLWPGLLSIRWDIVWPLALVLIGVILLIRGRR